MLDPDEVSRLCYERFQQLPRRGKPEPGREWTLLAAVLQVTRTENSVEKEVVSMGTGTKCIGRTAVSPNGDVLNDSHAEVVARRGCIRRPVCAMMCGASRTILSCPVSPGGDASIIPMTHGPPPPCPPVTPGQVLHDGGGDLKRKAEEPSGAQNPKLPRLEGTEPQQEDRGDTEPPDPTTASSGPDPPVPDIHRTGAKCVPGGPADPQRPGVGYHSTGVLRLKPGRGEPTLSLSCSDKLARWGVLGFQGALLSHYLQEALCFSAVVVGRCPYSAEAMHRALVARCCQVSDLPAGFSVRPPVLLQSGLEFPFSQAQAELQHRAGQGRVSPCGAAISWCNVTEQPLDVTANGYKHGVTRKALGTPKARSLLCKLELFRSFLSLVSATDPSALPDSLRSELQTYWDYKQASQCYQQAQQQLLSQAFPLWPRGDRKLLLFH
uniref:tRNA-specific adenosine deaminase 1 n=1 Tax=Stegastes partitus TaxID=144197 RepID=A0A3B4ZDF8_9TELE